MPKTQKHIKKSARRIQRTSTQKNAKTGPIYVVFDLDGTLVDVDFKNNPPLPTPSSLSKTLITTNEFIDSKGVPQKYPMYLRPGTKQLLTYLFKNPKKYRVGVWTASFKNYSVGIVRKLFGEDYQKKLFCLFGTDEITDPKTGEPMRVVENIYAGRHLPSRIVNKKVVKDLQLLFDEYPKCNPTNTILVDDLAMHKQENPPRTRKNVYTIPEWNPHKTIHDNFMMDFLHAAKKHKLMELT
jgi:hypothetical protein